MSAGWLRIAAKELRSEARAKETLTPLLLVGALVVVIGALAFHDLGGDARVTSGVVWIGLAFASVAGAGRAFGGERDRGTLDTLLALPVERGAVYAGKAAAHFVLALVAALVLVPTWLLASGGAPAGAWPALGLVVVLGALGLAATGALLSALAANTRARDALLPVLLLPLLIPLLVSTTHATTDILQGLPFAEWRGELLILAGYDLAFVAASWLLFDFAVGGGAA